MAHCRMLPMPNVTTTAIITVKDTTVAIITVEDTNVVITMGKTSTVATRRVMRAAVGITESK